MRTPRTWAVGFVGAAVAFGIAGASSPDLTQVDLDELTPIESTTTPDQLDLVLGGGSGSAADTTVIETLAAIANDATQDVGVQVRAIRDLGDYAEPAAHAELVSLLQAAPSTNRGPKVVLLRSAIEAFGALGTLGATGSGDDQYLIPLLAHPSQDIRAAAALALGNLCDPDAIQALRTQFGEENVPQVQYAISEALRVLGACPAAGSQS